MLDSNFFYICLLSRNNRKKRYDEMDVPCPNKSMAWAHMLVLFFVP